MVINYALSRRLKVMHQFIIPNLMTMRKLILLFVTIISTFSAFSQSADMRIANSLNTSDWFGLEENYARFKDSIQTDYLKLMAEIMIDYHFNRPDEALNNINVLLTNHQSEIGGQNALNMAILACQIKGLNGNYRDAALNSQSIINQLKAQNVDASTIKGVDNIFNFYNKLKDVQAPSITRQHCDISVPIKIEKEKLPTTFEPKGYRGTHIYIPVDIEGKTYRFIFDTGAGTSLNSEDFAKKIGAKIQGGSLCINSILPGATQGRTATLDSMKIGNMVFRHPFLSIVPPNALDSIKKIDAVLGMDFIS